VAGGGEQGEQGLLEGFAGRHAREAQLGRGSRSGASSGSTCARGLATIAAVRAGESVVPAARGGPYPPRDGNAVTPWIDGLPFYTRLAAAFRAARRQIWAIVSFIQPGFCFPDGTDWWDLLDECAGRGGRRAGAVLA
jgi:phosphatidylserine/phosphatidylglycerophosphate/cardiolipin synthase-like enzyme